MRGIAIVVGLVLSVAGLHAQQSPFDGRWKLNLEKSDFRGVTVSIADKGNGEYEFSQFGQSYRFRIDGKEYPSFVGSMARWRQTGPNTWETAVTMKGETIATFTLTLAPDGKTSTWQTRGKRPDGGTYVEDTTFTRTDVRKDLVGAWTQQSTKTPTPMTVEFRTTGDRFRFAIVDLDLGCDVTMDGKDHPCTGAMAGEGTTAAVVRKGDTLELTQKLKGSVFVVSRYSVSPDGSTLTERGKGGDGQTYTSIYDRVR